LTPVTFGSPLLERQAKDFGPADHVNSVLATEAVCAAQFPADHFCTQLAAAARLGTFMPEIEGPRDHGLAPIAARA
jgi:hypothetical protein